MSLLRNIIMYLFINLAKPFSRYGFGRLPGTRRAYRYLSKYLIPDGLSTVFYDRLVLDIPRRAYPEMLVSAGDKYVPMFTRVFKNFVTPGTIVVDLGAALGYYTLLAIRGTGPTGHVYAFEPHPESFRLLRLNTARANSTNVTLINAAVTDKEGTIPLYLSTSNPLAHSLGSGRTSNNYINVRTISLDRYMKNTKVDVVKMNIEGSELLALKGMRNIIEQNPNLKMIVELDPKALRGMATSPQEYLDALSYYFDLQVIHMKSDTAAPYRNLAQVTHSLSRWNSVTFLICTRRKHGNS